MLLRSRQKKDQNIPETQASSQTSAFSQTSTSFQNSASQNTKSQQVKSKYNHTFLVHTTLRASPLSKESSEQNYRGLLNLSLLLLFVLNLRLVIENYIKYGLLLKLPSVEWIDANMINLVHAAIVLLIDFVFAIFSLLIQKIGVFVDILSAINCLLAITIPTLISWYKITHPLISGFPLSLSTILFLKLISFALVNRDLKRNTPTTRDSDAAYFQIGSPVLTSVRYPHNLTFSNLFYFIAAPTLCYQCNYPLTPRFRLKFFLKRFLEFTISLGCLVFLIEQYVKPTLKNSIDIFNKKPLNLINLVERILKLSVVNVVIWLMGFYSFFHSWLNMLAELLRFGDRRFYLPFWNASNISEYWRLWFVCSNLRNAPVYHFCKRHIYLPLLENGFAPSAALFIVFFTSAVLHELIIGVPTHNISGIAFWGMLGQIPLIFFTNALENIVGGDRQGQVFTAGNLIFCLHFL